MNKFYPYKFVTAEAALQQAIEYEQQMKAEHDPRLISHCRGEMLWWLQEAVRLETTNAT